MMLYHHVITKEYIYMRILDIAVHSVGLAERSKKFF